MSYVICYGVTEDGEREQVVMTFASFQHAKDYFYKSGFQEADFSLQRGKQGEEGGFFVVSYQGVELSRVFNIHLYDDYEDEPEIEVDVDGLISRFFSSYYSDGTGTGDIGYFSVRPPPPFEKVLSRWVASE